MTALMAATNPTAAATRTSLTPTAAARAAVAALSPIEAAVVSVVAYGDVFSWPAYPAEIHRHLPLRATRREVDDALSATRAAGLLATTDGLVTLAGREALVDHRHRREAASRAAWPRAVRWARLVAGLPFVRMVAITGSLAVHGAEDADDVDLFVVTEDGRLWLARAMAMGLVRAARVVGVRLCPNYLVTESRLRLDDRSLFTARELAQMVPVQGSATYLAVLRHNAWYRDFLPNVEEPKGTGEVAARAHLATRTLRRLATVVLRSRLGGLLERWEMERKVRYLSSVARSSETRYDAGCCKGHANEHGRRALEAFEARLARLAEAS